MIFFSVFSILRCIIFEGVVADCYTLLAQIKVVYWGGLFIETVDLRVSLFLIGVLAQWIVLHTLK